jgi:hypothetical protein
MALVANVIDNIDINSGGPSLSIVAQLIEIQNLSSLRISLFTGVSPDPIILNDLNLSIKFYNYGVLNYNKTRPILGALMLGYYFSTFGEEFKYYKGLSFYDGEFKGKKSIDNSLLSLLYSNKILRRVIKKAHKKIVGSHI